MRLSDEGGTGMWEEIDGVSETRRRGGSRRPSGGGMWGGAVNGECR